MTLSLPTIVRCPTCPTIYVLEYPASGTTATNAIWSDRWTESTGVQFQDQAAIFLCPRCAKWQWINDAEDLFEVPFAITQEGIPEISTFDTLTVEQLTSALEQSWPADREAYLRTQLLWLQNHPRRQGDEPTQLSHELMENLERLVELIDPAEDGLTAAELHRELGDFAGATAALQQWRESASAAGGADSSAADQGAQLGVLLQSRIEERSIEPFCFVPAEADDDDSPKTERDLRNTYDEGFSLFPPLEDVFAFPDAEKAESERPVLSIRLDTIDPEWDGWATMFRDCETQAVLRFGRIFRDDEWEEYQKASDWWKTELQWFWSKRSAEFEFDGTSEDANRYFRVLYFLKNDLWQYHEFMTAEYDSETGTFDSLYDDPTLEGDYYRLFWMHHWGITGSTLSVEDAFVPETVSRLRDEHLSEREEATERRLAALKGLDYLETGGPSWFQGLDETPNIDGRACEFVAQIWLDYINAGHSLVYLFYDPVTHTVAQVYDYD